MTVIAFFIWFLFMNCVTAVSVCTRLKKCKWENNFLFLNEAELNVARVRYGINFFRIGCFDGSKYYESIVSLSVIIEINVNDIFSSLVCVCMHMHVAYLLLNWRIMLCKSVSGFPKFWNWFYRTCNAYTYVRTQVDVYVCERVYV
jgi:hypothetical protein